MLMPTSNLLRIIPKRAVVVLSYSVCYPCYDTVLALREVWESETPKIALGLPKINARKSGTPNFLRYLVIYNKNLE